MIAGRTIISASLAKEAAKFLSNMSLAVEEYSKLHRTALLTATNALPLSASRSSSELSASLEIVECFVSAGVHDAVFAILKSVNAPLVVKHVATHALQNVVAFAGNGAKLVSACLEPVLKFLRDTVGGGGAAITAMPVDVGAAQVLYNLACVPQCRDTLVACNLHIKALDLMMVCREGALKSAFLQILVQLSSSAQCVRALLAMDLVAKLEAQLSARLIQCDVWRDISLMLLAVVAFARESLSDAQHVAIVRVLRAICSPAAMRAACAAYVRDRERERGADKRESAFNGSNGNGSSAFDGAAFTREMLSTHLDEILDNGANVLKFVSISFSSFTEVDPVLREVVGSGRGAADRDELVENVSHVLYNMTCRAENVPLMLRDESHLNTMIRLMRSGSGRAHVQENVAHAMRTLCAAPQCVELLLRHEMLSDLVVIALLRTASEELKVVCSEAFYNMLTHEKTRLRLLQGDLWWALMRLGRTDSEAVRAICIRALADLAAPPAPAQGAQDAPPGSQLDPAQAQRISALRAHHVLSFMRDLSTASAPAALPQCLQVVHNVLSQFALLPPQSERETTERQRERDRGSSKNAALNALRQEELFQKEPNGSVSSAAAVPSGSISGGAGGIAVNPTNNVNVLPASALSSRGGAAAAAALPLYQSHEIVAAIRIAADALHRAASLDTVRAAALLLLKCAQLRSEVDGVDSEFVSIEVVEVLKARRDAWARDAQCRLLVSRLLFELSRSRLFTRSVLLGELAPALLSAVEAETDSGENALEICENALAAIKLFVLGEGVAPREVVALPVWPLLLRHALAADSPSVLRHAAALMLFPGGSTSKKTINAVAAAAAVAATPTAAAAVTPTPPRRAQGSFSAGPTGLVRPRATLFAPGALGGATDATATAAGGPLSEAGLRGAAPQLFRTQGIALALLAHCVDAQLSLAPRVLDGALVQGLLRAEFVDHAWTKNNLLRVLHACSTHEKTVQAVLQEESFALLTRYVHTSVGTMRQEKAQEFGSCFLRNATLHGGVAARLVAMPRGVVVEFVREIVETFTTAAVAADLSVFFYQVAPHLVSSGGGEQALSPGFVLDMLQRVARNPVVAHAAAPIPLSLPAAREREKERDGSSIVGKRNPDNANSSPGVDALDVVSVNKFTVSVILDKYAFHGGVDPSFVQSMLQYVQSGAAGAVPERVARDVSLRDIASDFSAPMSADFVAVKESAPAALLLFAADDRLCWRPVLHREIKSQETVLLRFSSAQGEFCDKAEAVDALPITVFAKIVRTFDTVKGDMLHAGRGHRDGDGAIAEEGDENENDNDNDDVESAAAPLDLHSQLGLRVNVDVAPSDETRSVQSMSVQSEDSERDRENETDVFLLHSTPRHTVNAKYRREGGTDDKLPLDLVEVRAAQNEQEKQDARIAEGEEQDEKDEQDGAPSMEEKEEDDARSASVRSMNTQRTAGSAPIAPAPSLAESERESEKSKRSVVLSLKDEVAVARRASVDDVKDDGKRETESLRESSEDANAATAEKDKEKEKSTTSEKQSNDDAYADDDFAEPSDVVEKTKLALAVDEEEDAYLGAPFEPDEESVRSGRWV